MVTGQDDPSDGDDGRILSPDELDITDDEHVAEIEDGRYVVSPNDPIDDVPTADGVDTGTESSDGPDPGRGRTQESDPRPRTEQAAAEATAADLSEQAVRQWLTTRFEDADSRYGFDVTATFDGQVRQRQMMSNDVVTIFESLILWYAQQIDSTTPVEEVLGILLMEANVPIRYPASSLQTVLDGTDLSGEDSISDLAQALSEDGFRI